MRNGNTTRLVGWSVLVLWSVLAMGCRTSPSPERRIVKMYGAAPEGTYTRAMQALAAKLKGRFGHRYTFKVQTSAGSVENVRDLHSRLAHIALLQEDVAHYFEQGGHPLLKISHQKSGGHVKSLCFFFWEYVYVLARPGTKSLSTLRRVNIGSMYGGSGITAINLRDQLQYSWKFDLSADPVAALQSSKTDAVIVIGSSIDAVTARLRQAKVPFVPVPLSARERQVITASFPFYHETIAVLQDAKGNKVSVPTIGIRALLAVQKDLPLPLVRSILQLFTTKEGYAAFSKALPAIKSIRAAPWLDPKAATNMRFARFPMPVHPVVFELHWGKNPYANLYLFGFPLIALLALVVWMRRRERYKSYLPNAPGWGATARHLFEKFWADAILALSLVLYVILTTNWIKYLEIQAFLRNEVASPSHFVYMNFQELFTWIFVFIATGYEDTVFPKTMLGKILASSIRIVLISSVVYILGRISADFLKTLIKGREMSKTYNLKDHVVICNWNRKGEKIVEELHSTLLQEHDMARPAIIITQQEIRFPDTPAFEDTYCIPGDAVSPWKLRNANVASAFAVIILAEDDIDNADTHTIMVAMEIAELLDEAREQGQLPRSPHIAAEILDGRNAKYLRRAGVNEIISGNELGVKLLAQTAVTPGVTAFMDDLLTYTSASNEVYIVDPPAALVARKARFSEIIHHLLEQRTNCEHALLVGIQRGNPPVMMVNPSEKDFTGLEQGDRLVLIARKRPVL